MARHLIPRAAMDAFRQDLRHALRMLARSPAFTMVAVLTLAVGIGANATIFGFLNALLLRPFPLLEAERLVAIWERHPQQGAPGGARGGDQNPLSVADYLDLAAGNAGLDRIAAYRYRDFVVTGAGEPERVPGYLVTPGYFETLGVRPAMGRIFEPEEGLPGHDTAVLLSHGFWQRRFGGEPSVLGRSFVLGARRHTVVGILPPRLNFPPGAPDVFVPLAFSEAEKTERGKLSLLAVARLRDADIRTAQAALDTLSARLARAHPDTNTARTHFLLPLRELQTGFVRPFLLLFEGAAAFVLMVACANVAGLLIARGTGRGREIALRAALGATRGRVVRQLLTEGLVLSVLGAAGALWLAQGGVELIRNSLPPDMVRWVVGWSEIRLDARVLVFTLALALVTTIAFALVPALGAARVDLLDALKGPRQGAPGTPRRRLRSALVSLQVTLCLVLLAGALLMTRGFVELVDLYQGFDPERVVTLRLKLPEWQYAQDPGVVDFYDRVVRGVEGVPGVESAGVVSHPPADLGPIPRTSFLIEGRPVLRPEETPSADLQTISAGYFTSMRLPLLRGRLPGAADGAGAPTVALVSASLAERFWPGEDPIGRRVRVGDTPAWRTVIGVVADVKQYWFDRQPRPTLYVPFPQLPRRDLFLVVRGARDTDSLVAAARARVRDVDPQQPVDEIRTMATVVSESASIIRLAAALMVVLGAIAFLLAAVGVHGVIAEHVAQRTREIGIRMALGARRLDVLRLVSGGAAKLVGAGLVAGVVGAVAVGRVMASALFGIVRPDALGLAGATALLALVAAGAVWFPARRATRVDPLAALRQD